MLAQRMLRATSGRYVARQQIRSIGNTTTDGPDTQDTDVDALRQQLLDEALKLVPQVGWTVDALQAAATKIGLPEVAHGLVHAGPVGLIEHHCRTSAAKTVDAMCTETTAQLHTVDKIRVALRTRLMLQHPINKQWPEALAILAQPTNVPLALSLLRSLVDDIWYHAGDRSVDLSWYTKRATLASVYASSEVFMTQDESPDYLHTMDFVDRRLQDVELLGKATSQLSNASTILCKTVQGLVFPVRK